MAWSLMISELTPVRGDFAKVPTKQEVLRYFGRLLSIKHAKFANNYCI